MWSTAKCLQVAGLQDHATSPKLKIKNNRFESITFLVDVHTHAQNDYSNLRRILAVKCLRIHIVRKTILCRLNKFCMPGWIIGANIEMSQKQNGRHNSLVCYIKCKKIKFRSSFKILKLYILRKFTMCLKIKLAVFLQYFSSMFIMAAM